ncbi:hypothetical protein CLF_108783 [Clonorchis sinensis]|uniref:Uncharacterized protein n=1 Tax=Clonorchis sinensis TaxID=79923 RepID=G7YII8_CLOSI|nr:hypothetical protein CLF_108783 [Clonorchis sinensis]
MDLECCVSEANALPRRVAVCPVQKSSAKRFLSRFFETPINTDDLLQRELQLCRLVLQGEKAETDDDQCLTVISECEKKNRMGKPEDLLPAQHNRVGYNLTHLFDQCGQKLTPQTPVTLDFRQLSERWRKDLSGVRNVPKVIFTLERDAQTHRIHWSVLVRSLAHFTKVGIRYVNPRSLVDKRREMSSDDAQSEAHSVLKREKAKTINVTLRVKLLLKLGGSEVFDSKYVMKSLRDGQAPTQKTSKEHRVEQFYAEFSWLPALPPPFCTEYSKNQKSQPSRNVRKTRDQSCVCRSEITGIRSGICRFGKCSEQCVQGEQAGLKCITHTSIRPLLSS